MKGKVDQEIVKSFELFLKTHDIQLHIERILQTGSFGIVMLGRWRNGKLVAVKLEYKYFCPSLKDKEKEKDKEKRQRQLDRHSHYHTSKKRYGNHKKYNNNNNTRDVHTHFHKNNNNNNNNQNEKQKKGMMMTKYCSLKSESMIYKRLRGDPLPEYKNDHFFKNVGIPECLLFRADEKFPFMLMPLYGSNLKDICMLYVGIVSPLNV